MRSLTASLVVLTLLVACSAPPAPAPTAAPAKPAAPAATTAPAASPAAAAPAAGASPAASPAAAASPSSSPAAMASPAASPSPAAAAPAPAAAAAKPSGPPEKLTLQLNWLRNVQFAGVFMAIDKGFYAEEAIELETIIGGGQINTVQVVLAGGADIGIGGAETLISGKVRAGDVRVLGAMEQKAASALTCMPNSNIKTIKDVVGKKLGASAPQRPGLETLLKVNGISPDDVTIVTSGTGIEPLLSGQIDCRVTFATNEPITMKLQGIEPTVLLAFDYGIQQQGDPIFVTGETLTKKEAALVRFMRATMRGWTYALANPEESVDTIIAKFGENLNRAQQIEALKAFGTLIVTDHSNQYGLLAINRASWEQVAQVMLDQEKLDAPFDVGTLLVPRVQEAARKP